MPYERLDQDVQLNAEGWHHRVRIGGIQLGIVGTGGRQV